MQNEILAPAAVLVGWSLIMLFWMAATRLPRLAGLGRSKEEMRGGRGRNLEGVLPDRVNWKAHNYDHLMEQPTLFYALVAILAIAGAGMTDVWLAWLYVASRIAHSLWQSLVNTIPVRFALFLIGTLVLVAMTIRALIILF